MGWDGIGIVLVFYFILLYCMGMGKIVTDG